MNPSEIAMLVFQVLGGLSLFIYGMHVMTGSLRALGHLLDFPGQKPRSVQ